MASGSHRMPANPHIVGRIEESRVDTRPLADDPLQKSGIAAVATSDPMLAEKSRYHPASFVALPEGEG